MIYDELKGMADAIKQTAKIEARLELVKELKSIEKPSKQIIELIKKYEKHNA